jgi:predicted secreted hydrolase
MSFLKRLLGSDASPSLPWMPSASRPESLGPVRLPFDEAPHDRAMEWWHFMGYVEPQVPDGWAYRLSFVVSVLKAEVRGLANLVGLAILIDHRREAYTVGAKLSPMGAAHYEPSDGRRFRFHFGPQGPSRPGPPEAWEVAGGMGSYTLNIDTSEQLTLSLRQPGPAVLLGTGDRLDGIVTYAQRDQMAYYAWPSLEVSGVRGTGADQMLVQGRARMEHQWGDVRVGDYRWKYLAVDVAYTGRGGREQFLFFRAEHLKGGAPVVYGIRIEADGHYSVLDLHHGLGPDHTSPAWNDVYPLSTRIRASSRVPYAGTRLAGGPQAEVTLTVEPLFRDQECRTGIPEAFFPRFWEGACKVSGTVTVSGEDAARVVDEHASWAITELAGYR